MSSLTVFTAFLLLCISNAEIVRYHTQSKELSAETREDHDSLLARREEKINSKLDRTVATRKKRMFNLSLLTTARFSFHPIVRHFLRTMTSRAGLTGDECEKNSDCEDPRTCIGGLRGPCNPEDVTPCACEPVSFTACEKSSDCDRGERCYKSMTAVDDEDTCHSCESPPGDSPETVDDGEGNCVCIAAEALSHLPKEALVFPRHVRASVLCDVNGNCATPGHIVLHNNQPMMMKTYCLEHECERAVKFVNSPRIKRGLRIASNTPNLVYSSFAARYETVMEEHALRLLLQTGM